MNLSKTWLVYSISVVICFLMPRCNCQDYAQVECLRDSDCEPCSICFDRNCEKNLEICWDQVDNDCDGETDENCEDVCDGVVCHTPPPRECLDAITLRYFLSPGRCVEGSCDYESAEVICDSGCEDDHCLEDLCIGLSCNDFNPCTDDSCDPGSGCSNVPNSLPCEDGNQCTVFDVCEDSTCKSGAPRDCDDGIECTQDHCDVIEGCVNIPDDTRCDDGDPCTDDTCDTTTGCSNAYNTVACDDGDPCTMDDSCNQGVCLGEPLDADGDGSVSDECGGDDCDDSDPDTYPSAEELCAGKDNNCDGLVDIVGTDLCNYEAFCSNTELVFCEDSPGPTIAQAVIDDAKVWCAANSPFLLEADLAILASASLSIGPCTEIRASDGVYFNVRGQLYVAGHPDQPATFMSSSPNPSRGAWGGIHLGERSNSKAHLSSANINDALNGFSFDVCGRGCVVSVDKCIFRNNEIAIHGYIGGEDDVVEIRDTDITDNTCGSDGGWKNFVGCSFSGNDWGICNGERVNLDSCTISNNIVGLEGSRGRVEDCYISGNSEVGVAPTFEGYELIGNTIINNKIGIIAGGWDGSVSPVHDNVICNNVDYDIQMTTSFDLDATNNWWCTIDPAEIATRIYDVYDDSNLGQVIFEPFLDVEP